MNALTLSTPAGTVAVPVLGSMAMALMPTSLREAMDLATMMSKGKLVPEALRNSPADCLLVIEQAMRWSMSPFAVAQEVSVISGKLMHSGKIVAAAVQSSGLLKERLRYEYSGEGDTREVRVVGTLRGESEPRDVTVKIKDVRTSNQQWTKQPDQQLAYSGSRAWGRRHTPEVMLGVWTPEEFDAEERGTGRGRGTTIAGQAEAVQPAAQQIAGEAAVPTLDLPGERGATPSESLREVAEGMRQAAKPSPRDAARAFADSVIARAQAVVTEDELHDITRDAEVNKRRTRLAAAFPALDAEIAEAMGEAYARLTGQDGMDDADEPFPGDDVPSAPMPEAADAEVPA